MTFLNQNQLKRQPIDWVDNVGRSYLALSSSLEVTVNNINVCVDVETLIDLKILGEGAFSTVRLMRDPQKNVDFAVKIIYNLSEESVKITEMDIEVGKSVSSKFKIHYYGAILKIPAIWILMEPMDLSVTDFYTKLLKNDKTYHLPSSILGYMAYCSVYGLEDLHVAKIIHRDVKPSNMLIDKIGNFKLCDFGISGIMKDSLAKTSVGTNAYLAPERIDPSTCHDKFSIKSDIWSLGLSIMELAMMQYPYNIGLAMMAQLDAIVLGPVPRLCESSPHFNDVDMINFFDCTMTKPLKDRKYYNDLKMITFIKKYDNESYFLSSKNKLSHLISQLLS